MTVVPGVKRKPAEVRSFQAELLITRTIGPPPVSGGGVTETRRTARFPAGFSLIRLRLYRVSGPRGACTPFGIRASGQAARRRESKLISHRQCAGRHDRRRTPGRSTRFHHGYRQRERPGFRALSANCGDAGIPEIRRRLGLPPFWIAHGGDRSRPANSAAERIPRRALPFTSP